MQKLGMIQAFTRLQETEDATFVHPYGQADQSRLIKMRVLAEKPVNLYLIPVEYDYENRKVTAHFDGEDDVRFLAHIDAGHEQIEFHYVGSFCLRLMGGDVWLDTYDNSAFIIEDVDPISFARLYEREERDPRILEMERLARHNQQMLREQMQEALAQQNAEWEATLARREQAVMAQAEEVFRAGIAARDGATSAATTSATAQGAVVSPTGNSEPNPAAPAGNGGDA